ncbi:MAG: MoxR family ATPase [Planctomycetota bacterium]|nr:MAG: MoxR family ATPase [Planctomycetota bacterium]
MIATLETEMAKVLVGQRELLRRLIICLLCDGHCLLEGLPGLAKTTVVKALAACWHASFARVQFTPDLLPADIIGTRIYEGGIFAAKRGPIFANLVLADEINRAPAKVQSALLEAMQERQVTIGDETFPLPRPFLVLATQNPIEQEGTYPLPEAQTDRFLMKVRVDYPSAAEEREVLDRSLSPQESWVEPVLRLEDLGLLRSALHGVHIDDRLKDYCLALVRRSRDRSAEAGELPRLIQVGASPRAVMSLAQAARAHAMLSGQHFVTPQDVKAVAPDILRHRLILSFEAEAEDLDSDAVIAQLLRQVPVP